MLIKNLIDEDFCQYKKPSMFIGMPKCSFKCDKECGESVCQNSELATAPSIEIDEIEIAKRFYSNPITDVVVFGGLEPFDTFGDLTKLIASFILVGEANNQPIPTFIIFTGYYPDEIRDFLDYLKRDDSAEIIIKFGRYIPNKPSIYDELLGVTLASNNQYAMKLEDINDI